MSSPGCPNARGSSRSFFRSPLLSPPGCVRWSNSDSQKCWFRLSQVSDLGREFDQLIHAFNFGYFCENVGRVIFLAELGERFGKRRRTASGSNLCVRERAENLFRADVRAELSEAQAVRLFHRLEQDEEWQR